MAMRTLEKVQPAQRQSSRLCRLALCSWLQLLTPCHNPASRPGLMALGKMSEGRNKPVQRQAVEVLTLHCLTWRQLLRPSLVVPAAGHGIWC